MFLSIFIDCLPIFLGFWDSGIPYHHFDDEPLSKMWEVVWKSCCVWSTQPRDSDFLILLPKHDCKTNFEDPVLWMRIRTWNKWKNAKEGQSNRPSCPAHCLWWWWWKMLIWWYVWSWLLSAVYFLRAPSLLNTYDQRRKKYCLWWY